MTLAADQREYRTSHNQLAVLIALMPTGCCRQEGQQSCDGADWTVAAERTYYEQVQQTLEAI